MSTPPEGQHTAQDFLDAGARAIANAGPIDPARLWAPTVYADARQQAAHDRRTAHAQTLEDVFFGGPIEVELTDETTPAATWGRVDLGAVLAGAHVREVATLLTRTDGPALLYPGKVHSFAGEPESAKSWGAQVACAQTMMAGEAVLYVDFESDAASVVGRFLALGVPGPVLVNLLDYRRPDAAPGSSLAEEIAFLEMLGGRYAVAVLDGVTEALSVHGVESSNNNDEVAAWIRRVPRKIAQGTGAAVVLVDHVTKSSDGRGRYALGAQAKLAGLDGAAYVFDVLEPAAPGRCGRVAMRVAKDRPGQVRAYAGPARASDRTAEAAVLVLDSTEEGRIVATLEPPSTEDFDGGKPFRPTWLMDRVSHFLATRQTAGELTSVADVESGVEAKKRGDVRTALTRLIEEGYVTRTGPAKPRSSYPTLHLVKGFDYAIEEPAK